MKRWYEGGRPGGPDQSEECARRGDRMGGDRMEMMSTTSTLDQALAQTWASVRRAQVRVLAPFRVVVMALIAALVMAMALALVSATFLTFLTGASATSATQYEDLALRSSVANVVDNATYVWGPQDFPGFYYDLDDDVGTERLAVTISGDAIEELGAVYTTSCQMEEIEFEEWGSRWTLAFLGEPYFAGYADGHLHDESGGEVLLKDERLSRILIDEDEERTIGTGSPLPLGEGYELLIGEIDVESDKVSLELFKNGARMEPAVVEPSKENATLEDRTYTYTRPVGGKDVVFIAVHFKNAFRSGEKNLATVDGIWQISEETLSVKEGGDWDRMTIQDVDPENVTLIMANEEDRINLVRDRDTKLVEDIRIRTADQDEISDENPLRFCVYREISKPATAKPGTYEYVVRGAVAEVANETTAWNSTSFAGFYYDLDEDVGRESLTLNVTRDRIEEEGAAYTTRAQELEFEFEEWGSFWTLAFMGEPYFAGYIEGFLYEESDEPNMLAQERLARVFVDEDKRRTISTDDPIRLEDGYKLVLDSVDEKGEKVSLELFKDGAKVDSAVLELFEGSTPEGATYAYKRRVGGADEIVVVAIHFRSAFSSDDDGFAEIDGVWQILDEPVPVEVEEGGHDKMTIEDVSSRDMAITMTNEDPITLERDDDFALMGDIRIRTADQEDVSGEEPLRFYVYEVVTVEP